MAKPRRKLPPEENKKSVPVKEISRFKKWFFKYKPEIYGVLSFVLSSAVILFQTWRLEKQFIAEKVGKPIVNEITFQTYKLRKYWPNDDSRGDSLKKYYGYLPDIRHPDPYDASDEPYMISHLAYQNKLNGKGPRLRGLPFTLKELEAAPLTPIAKDSLKYFESVKVFQLLVGLKNSGATNLTIYKYRIYIKAGRTEEFELFQSGDDNLLLTPGVSDSRYRVNFAKPIDQNIDRPFQVKIELFYTREYDQESASAIVTATCDPLFLTFGHIDQYYL